MPTLNLGIYYLTKVFYLFRVMSDSQKKSIISNLTLEKYYEIN